MHLFTMTTHTWKSQRSKCQRPTCLGQSEYLQSHQQLSLATKDHWKKNTKLCHYITVLQGLVLMHLQKKKKERKKEKKL